MWLAPWAQIHYPGQLKRIQQKYPDDLAVCPYFCKQEPAKKGDRHGVGVYVDEWGTTYQKNKITFLYAEVNIC